MLSLDLFATQFEKELREGAVDDLEYRRMNDLREKMEMLMQAYKKADTDEVKAAIMKRYQEYKSEREGYMKVREQQVPSKQDPFAYVKPEPKGIGDIQDPRQKMAQLAQQSKKGPLANVGAGLKAFIKGEPEPMGEEQGINPRALGVANFQRLVKANMGAYPSVSLEFIRPEENFKLDQKGLDLISDYYDGLENDQAKNYFIYRVLPSGDETLKVLKQLGWNPQQIQQNLPGIPTQGELPLQEKKKSSNDDLETGDVKVARELQKLRAQYPAAKSDVEAVARAEIDSTERSQQQLAAIRGANEKQDALLKQLVALDQEQGREISGLDKENNNLEQRLAQVQSTNARLQQAIGKMTGAKKVAPVADKIQTTAPQGSADIAQGGIIDVGAPVAPTPDATSAAKVEPTTPSAMGNIVRTIRALPKDAPSTAKDTEKVDKDTKEPEEKPVTSLKALRSQQAANRDDFQLVGEHGGGIGPRQHWQDLMQEGQPQELIHRYLAIDAETDVDAVRKAIQAISRDPALSVTSKSRLLGQIGMIIRRHRLPIGRAYYQFMQQYMEDINETALNPQDPQGDYEAKRRALHDLSLNKDVDQQAVLQRRLDLDREAKANGLAETVTNVKAGMAEIYRRLAPKIERHRDSFLAGQLYDELENYAELHGAEGEFKRMMSTARSRAHMEYDTNPGGFQNWFWFLPFEDDMSEGYKQNVAAGILGAGMALGAVPSQAQIGEIPSAQIQQSLKLFELSEKYMEILIQRAKEDGRSLDNATMHALRAKARDMAAAQIRKQSGAQPQTSQQSNFPEQDSERMINPAFNKFEDKGEAEGTDDVKKRMSKLEALALAANRAGDDAKCKMYQQKIQSLKQKLSQSMAEGWSDQGNPTAYSVYIDGREWRAYKSDDHARAVAEKVRANLKRQGRDQTVTIAPSKAKRVQENISREPRTARERDDMIDKIRRMMTQDRNPANLQIMKKDIEMLQTKYRDLKEDSGSGEAVEMAIMRRMLIAHTDLIVEFGLDKVVDAIEEVAYNVGDTDEIGSSDVSGWVRQVKQILGVDA